MPQPEKQLDVIKVTGLEANVERAKQGLLERVKELQAEQEDRVHIKKYISCFLQVSTLLSTVLVYLYYSLRLLITH